jgi:hypothetical protein
VIKAEKEAKVTLDPIEVKTNYGFNQREIGDILDIIEKYQEALLAEWDKLHPAR